MTSICFEYDQRQWHRDMWLYLVTAFEVQGYERGRPEIMDSMNNFGVLKIQNAYDLPLEPRLVIITPKNSKYLPGEVNLYKYVHPQNAIYYFGSDRSNLGPEMFEGLEYELVYIPQNNMEVNELWTHQAGAITLYDIEAKKWQM